MTDTASGPIETSPDSRSSRTRIRVLGARASGASGRRPASRTPLSLEPAWGTDQAHRRTGSGSTRADWHQLARAPPRRPVLHPHRSDFPSIRGVSGSDLGGGRAPHGGRVQGVLARLPQHSRPPGSMSFAVAFYPWLT